MKSNKDKTKFKASNLELQVENGQVKAYSYDWWRFVDTIGGKIFFNSYAYSASTRIHQHKVKSKLEELGIKIDFDVEFHEGLQSPEIQDTIKKLFKHELESK
jgi:hypothetical protein